MTVRYQFIAGTCPCLRGYCSQSQCTALVVPKCPLQCREEKTVYAVSTNFVIIPSFLPLLFMLHTWKKWFNAISWVFFILLLKIPLLYCKKRFNAISWVFIVLYFDANVSVLSVIFLHVWISAVLCSQCRCLC